MSMQQRSVKKHHKIWMYRFNTLIINMILYSEFKRKDDDVIMLSEFFAEIAEIQDKKKKEKSFFF